MSERLAHATTQRPTVSDPASGAILDDVAYIAAHALHCPIAVITLSGFRFSDSALCGTALVTDDPWVVRNGAVDPRTLTSSMAADQVGLRFYAGVPLLVAGGESLGMLAVIGCEPRTIAESELAILKKLAALVACLLGTRLELRMALGAKDVALTSAG